MSDDKGKTESQKMYDKLVHEKYNAEALRDRRKSKRADPILDVNDLPQYLAQYQQQPVLRLGGIPARRAEQGLLDRVQELEVLLAAYADERSHLLTTIKTRDDQIDRQRHLLAAHAEAYHKMTAESLKAKTALGEVEHKLIVAEEAKQILAKNSVAREAHMQAQLDELQKRFDEKEMIYCQMIKTRDDQILRQHRELLNSSVTASIPDKPSNKGGRPVIRCQSSWDIDS